MRFLAVFIMLFVFAAQARADDCTGREGYYLNNAGECVECELRYYYCPGDNTLHDCPDKTHLRTTFPDFAYNPKIFNYQYTLANDNTKIEGCRILYWLENKYGKQYVYATYDPNTGKYDKDLNSYYPWLAVSPGYYLTDKATALGSTYLYYKTMRDCPAGGYCPGKTEVLTTETNIGNDYLPNFGLEVCPKNTYSDDGASECTPCPARTGNSGDTIDDHAGIGSCQPIECPAGQYIGDDGYTCTTCDIGYYCPGDNDRHYCHEKYPYESLPEAQENTPYYSDQPGATDCKKCPEIDEENLVRYAYWISGSKPEMYIHSRMDNCRAEWDYNTQNGWFRFSCTYGTSGYQTGTSSQKCMAGTTNVSTAKCDAGYYVDTSNPVMTAVSSSHQWWTKSYQDMTETKFCLPAGVGYYSVADSTDREKCPAGTSTHGDTAGDASECESLCTAGATEFHVGDYVFNIWPNSECASPAIRLGLSGGTCCVRLERNDGPGLNVDIDGTVYHTVN